MPKQPELSADLTRERVIGAAEAAALLNISLPHFRRQYRAGRVPAPIKLTDRKLGWRVGQLLDWMDSVSKVERPRIIASR